MLHIQTSVQVLQCLLLFLLKLGLLDTQLVLELQLFLLVLTLAVVQSSVHLLLRRLLDVLDLTLVLLQQLVKAHVLLMLTLVSIERIQLLISAERRSKNIAHSQVEGVEEGQQLVVQIDLVVLDEDSSQIDLTLFTL